MQKFCDVRFAAEDYRDSLFDLWKVVFGDSAEYINNFLDKAFVPLNTLCVCDGNKVVSALYLLESKILNCGKEYDSLYIYAAATLPQYRGRGYMAQLLSFADEVAKSRGISYLFLVPGEKSLFSMYENRGFKTGFYFKERNVKRFTCTNGTSGYLDYKVYEKCNDGHKGLSRVVFGHKGFNVFFGELADVKSIAVNDGYCAYSYSDGMVTVLELNGDEGMLLSEAFRLSGAEELILREPAKHDGVPCGMYKAFGDAPQINDAFIGVCGG